MSRTVTCWICGEEAPLLHCCGIRVAGKMRSAHHGACAEELQRRKAQEDQSRVEEKRSVEGYRLHRLRSNRRRRSQSAGYALGAPVRACVAARARGAQGTRRAYVGQAVLHDYVREEGRGDSPACVRRGRNRARGVLPTHVRPSRSSSHVRRVQSHLREGRQRGRRAEEVAAVLIFQFRHPWMTNTERFLHLPQALQFESVPEE